MARKTVAVLCVLALLFGASALSAQSKPDSPASQPVAALHDELLAVMKQAEKLGYAGRFGRLAPVIDRVFDLPAVARLTVRRYWGDFSNDQQQTFVAAFRAFTIDIYAQRFDGYNGESFEIVGQSAAAGGAQRVSSHIIKADGATIPLDYILRATEGRWRIINVIADGVSDLALKRSQYSGVLKKQGVAAFMARIKEKQAALPDVEVSGEARQAR